MDVRRGPLGLVVWGMGGRELEDEGLHEIYKVLGKHFSIKKARPKADGYECNDQPGEEPDSAESEGPQEPDSLPESDGKANVEVDAADEWLAYDMGGPEMLLATPSRSPAAAAAKCRRLPQPPADEPGVNADLEAQLRQVEPLDAEIVFFASSFLSGRASQGSNGRPQDGPCVSEDPAEDLRGRTDCTIVIGNGVFSQR